MKNKRKGKKAKKGETINQPNAEETLYFLRDVLDGLRDSEPPPGGHNFCLWFKGPVVTISAGFAGLCLAGTGLAGWVAWLGLEI